jgi:glycosyltransferase involved in cell wall biosynthesis
METTHIERVATTSTPDIDALTLINDFASDFPQELIGKKVLLASESLGPINGVSRTTQSLIDYLRKNGVNVATCAPNYAGQPIVASETKPERTPIVNKDWIRAIEKKSTNLGSRALGGAWTWHHERDGYDKVPQQSPAQTATTPRNPCMINRSRSEDAKRKLESNRLTRTNPEFRLQGLPLPYNPDLTVAYPFRLGVIYDNTFKPDLIYLASPASVGFQFLVQLRQLTNPIPTLLNFQTDLSHYSTILFPQPLDQYGVWLLQIVQGFLFQAPAVQTIFYPSAYVRKYMAATGAPEAKMQHLGRGVDTKQFQPSYRSKSYRKQIAPNGEIIFACISRLAPEKGFEFLAKAAIRLAATGLPFKLLIVGGNKNPVVEKEVHEYFAPLGDRVVFTGMLRGDALARAYAAADVFLHCSITETFGLVVLESMASGVPVIARDEGGPSETVKHGDTGFLIPPHDMDKFVAYAHMLATDESMRSEMGVKARAQALDTTWDKINNRVAIQLAAALNAVPVKDDEAKRKEGYYGVWADMAKVYLAVGIVWVFWFIAVVPLMLLGVLHGIVRKR